MPASVNEIKYGEDNPIERAPSLSEEDKYALKMRMEALDKLLDDKKLAKYKIEVFFTEKRTGRGHYPGAISLWESGTKFHGGGDTKLYECPGKFLKINDCTGFIPDASNGYGFLVCPSCQKVWQGEQVIGERLARLDSRHWAELILRFFVRLGHNCDIYLKYPKSDLRRATEMEQQRQLMGEQLHKVRSRREPHLYPLRNIVKDTSAGADLLGRIYAFLTA